MQGKLGRALYEGIVHIDGIVSSYHMLLCCRREEQRGKRQERKEAVAHGHRVVCVCFFCVEGLRGCFVPNPPQWGVSVAS